jgi:hypothetical protein
MTDLEIARSQLAVHSICLCKDGAWFTDDGRGISPMLRFLDENRDLRGFSAADQIVGKAAAMLFVKAGIAAVYGEVMSQSGAEFLEANGIPHGCGTLTEQIINRQGTGICPMEETVSELDDPEAAYKALSARLAAMRKG